MNVFRSTAVAICLAGAAAPGPGAAGPLPTSVAAAKMRASDILPVQWNGRGWTGELPPRPPVAADLAARLAERGNYPFARYPYYQPYYYYSYPRYSSYDYVYEWYYTPFYQHSGRPY
ncbi:MAG TPA: hypothetical protein VLX44_16745 [Xanthobacteraceae bacterium]|nr:hypothetical protein [Xanthobacteraceae bacterium]